MHFILAFIARTRSQNKIWTKNILYIVNDVTGHNSTRIILLCLFWVLYVGTQQIDNSHSYCCKPETRIERNLDGWTINNLGLKHMDGGDCWASFGHL